MNQVRWAPYDDQFARRDSYSNSRGCGVCQHGRTQKKRAAFVLCLMVKIPVMDFFLSFGRTVTRMLEARSKGVTAGTYDALIAATAVHRVYALLTPNVSDFKIFAGLKVEPYPL